MPPATKKICAGSRMRTSRVVSSCVSPANPANRRGTIASAHHQSSAVAATTATPIVPRTLSNSAAAPSSPELARNRE